MKSIEVDRAVKHYLSNINQYVPLRILLGLIVLALPALIVYWQLSSHLHIDLKAQATAFPSDQLSHFLQVRAFGRAGFNSGYFVLEQKTAPAAFSPYGPHGPVYALTYGIFARLLGEWLPYYSTITNVTLYSLGLLVFMTIVRPQALQLVSMLCIIASFLPSHVYWISTMQQGLHQMLAIVFAAIFFLLIARPEGVSRGLHVTIFMFFIYSALARVTWATLFPVYLVLLLRRYAVRNLLLTLILSIGLPLLSILAFNYLVAPFPSSTLDQLSVAPNVQQLVGILKSQFQRNMQVLQRDQNSIVTYLFRQVAALCLYSLAILAFKVMKIFVVRISALIGISSKQPGVSKDFDRIKEAFAHIGSLLPCAGLVLLLYVVHIINGYRTIAPHVLLSLFLLSAFKRYGAVAIFALMPFFYGVSYEREVLGFLRHNLSWSFVSYAGQFQKQVENHLVFNPNTSNRWCNTVLIARKLRNHELMTLPAGLGLSTLSLNSWEPDAMRPLRAKYLLLSREEKRAAENSDLKLQHITSTRRGELFYNPESGCP